MLCVYSFPSTGSCEVVLKVISTLNVCLESILFLKRIISVASGLYVEFYRQGNSEVNSSVQPFLRGRNSYCSQ